MLIIMCFCYEIQVHEIETDMVKISQWLEETAKNMLTETRIGQDCPQAEHLLKEHEQIELKCRVRSISNSYFFISNSYLEWGVDTSRTEMSGEE